jgi:hypothetical protein
MFMGMGTDREMMDMVPVVAGKGRSEDNMATRASIARSIAMEAEGEDIMAPRSSNTVHRREAVVREAAQWVTAITQAEAEAGGRAMDKDKEDTVEMEMQVAEAVVVVDPRIIEAVMIRGMGMGMAGIEGSLRTWKKRAWGNETGVPAEQIWDRSIRFPCFPFMASCALLNTITARITLARPETKRGGADGAPRWMYE